MVYRHPIKLYMFFNSWINGLGQASDRVGWSTSDIVGLKLDFDVEVVENFLLRDAADVESQVSRRVKFDEDVDSGSNVIAVEGKLIPNFAWLMCISPEHLSPDLTMPMKTD